MAEVFKTNFKKLNGENYSTWKYRMELLLQKDDLWNNVSKEVAVDKRDAAWTKKDAEARAFIALMVEDSQLFHLKKTVTANEMWEGLKGYHEKSTLSNKVQIMRRICNMKLSEGGNLEEHLIGMIDLFEKLSALGEEKLSDTWVVAMLLSSLPTSYDVLVTALETRAEKDLTIDLVKSKLIDDFRRRTSDEGSNNAMKISKFEKSNFKNKECFFCNKIGHKKSDCIQYKRWKEKQNKHGKAHAVKEETENQEFCFVSKDGKVDSEKWIIDSGATCHISSNIKLFENVNKNVKKQITVANGQTEFSNGEGTCRIQILNEEGKSINLKIENVLYVQSMDCNLLSVKELLDKGFDVNFEKKVCKIKYQKIGREFGKYDFIFEFVHFETAIREMLWYDETSRFLSSLLASRFWTSSPRCFAFYGKTKLRLRYENSSLQNKRDM